MSNRRDDLRTSLYRAFSDPLRVRILNLLRHKGELCKNDIAEFFQMPRGELSWQMNLLERAHLVSSRLDRHFRFYKLAEGVSPFHHKLLEALSAFEDLAEIEEDKKRQNDWTPQG